MLSAARNRKPNCQCLKLKDTYYLCNKIQVPVLILQLNGIVKDPGTFVTLSALLPEVAAGPGITGLCLQQIGREVGEKNKTKTTKTFLVEHF